ncbi:alpha/beta-hydrolase [Apiospora rasikravindrae]|uniref:Alpha/beta-hydrolase n=1 Tax=Apiospora rasikravindrae TaxID=990691 RepID=A0ABR1UAB5_9PEZI
MILGPVSYLDCLVFCVFLAPQLLIHVGLVETLGVVLQCLPFLVYKLPTSFIYERYFTDRSQQTPFVQGAAPFEDFVVRCVRYAFANIPPKVGRVFFSRHVALPFLRFRMLRHGIMRSPIHWHEYEDDRCRGVWIIKDPDRPIDVCVYYAHGGGFSMGSPYFYLEFLLTWVTLLAQSGYRNPAIFALNYTLVPDDSFPTQLHEAIAGYRHVLTTVRDASKICVSGDSAGGTIMLSLLLHRANMKHDANNQLNESGDWRLERPRMAAFISPWTTLISPRHRNTPSDYLDTDKLHRYALDYANGKVEPDDPLISPGNCRDAKWWKKACPSGGLYVAYGKEEVFASEVEDLSNFWEIHGVKASSRAEEGGIHAWPVASLFLCTSAVDRQKGLKALVERIKENITA